MSSLETYLAVFFWLLFTLFIACSENPQQLTSIPYGTNIPGTVKDTTLVVVKDTTHFIRSKVNTQNAARLLLGSSHGLEARPALRFTNYLEIPDSANIDSAKIKLFGSSSSGSLGNTPFTATLYPALAVWTSNMDSVWNDFNSNIDRTRPLGSALIEPSDTLEYTFTLNQDGIDQVNVWADSATDPLENFGVLIDFQSADYIQYFYAIASGSDPVLIIQYSLPGDTTVYGDTLLANYDIYIYQGTVPKIENRNYVSSLLVNNTLLQFDLNHFLASQGSEIAILSASIEMPIDLEHSYLNSRFGIGTQVAMHLTSELENGQVVVDSTNGLFAAVAKWSSDSSYIEIDANVNQTRLAEMIRKQMADSSQYRGFSVSFIDILDLANPVKDEKEFYSYLAYYKRQESEILRRARLRITYWIPAANRL